MKRILFIILISCLAIGAAGCTKPDWKIPPIGGGGTGGGEEKPDPDPAAKGTLVADGVDADTYKLIRAQGYNYETPDNSGSHAASPFRHIKQVYDAELKKHVFQFIIHIGPDDDRGLPDITDRQRNEIKTDANSPAYMVASEGQTHTYGWKFKLPEGFLATSSFCHIHQLKGYGGNDIGLPLITLTPRKKSSGKTYMQVIHNGAASAANNYLKEVSLDDFIGQWVQVTEKALFSHEGSYSLTITRISDGKELIKIENMTLDLWRPGATAIRPKYGIYRSFGAGGSLKPQMRDETLLFADFTLKEE